MRTADAKSHYPVRKYHEYVVIDVNTSKRCLFFRTEWYSSSKGDMFRHDALLDRAPTPPYAWTIS